MEYLTLPRISMAGFPAGYTRLLKKSLKKQVRPVSPKMRGCCEPKQFMELT
jgi:hypothetical protein